METDFVGCRTVDFKGAQVVVKELGTVRGVDKPSQISYLAAGLAGLFAWMTLTVSQKKGSCAGRPRSLPLLM